MSIRMLTLTTEPYMSQSHRENTQITKPYTETPFGSPPDARAATDSSEDCASKELYHQFLRYPKSGYQLVLPGNGNPRYVCMHAFMHACMYIGMHAYVHIYIYIYIYI